MKKLIILFTLVLSQYSLAVCDGTSQTIQVPDPVNSGTFNVEAKVFRPFVEANEKFPVIFILPPVVGETPVDQALAINLCANGFGAYVMNVRNDPPDEEEVTNLNVHEDTLIRAEFGIRQYLNQLRLDPEVSGNFGILGASYGGILTAYLMGVMPELRAHVILSGAGNISHLLAFSEQEDIKNLREKRMETFSITTQTAYEIFMRPWITREPMIFAPEVEAGSTFMFITSPDVEVPTADQRALADALESPKIIEINKPHIPGIIEASTVHAQEIVDFFESKLE